MHVSALPHKTQDYLKNIWDYSEATSTPMPLGVLAERMGQKPSTASEAVKKLAARDLVHHERYGGITLTAEGNRLATQVVRRHRLLEMFLVETLGLGWDEVHEEADMLEHSITDRLLDRIDDHLGHPARDPHGDPIPQADGSVENVSTCNLEAFAPGDEIIIERIHDRDPDLLRYLASRGVAPGTRATVLEPEYSGIRLIEVDGHGVPLAESSLWAINVRRA